MPTSDVTQPRFFLETFSKTGSWILQSETVKLPKAGRYYSSASHPRVKPASSGCPSRPRSPSRR